MDLFPLQPSFHNSSSDQDFRKSNNMRLEGERAHMTMIYEGKVFVFTDLRAEIAKQILQLAEDNEASPEIYTQTNHQISPTNSNKLNSSPSTLNFVEVRKEESKFDISMDDMTCALPIARRNSLQRFLEKRMDRHVGHEVPFHLAAVRSEPQGKGKWWVGLVRHVSQ